MEQDQKYWDSLPVGKASLAELDMQEHQLLMAKFRAQIKQIQVNDKRAEHLARVKAAYGGKLPVYRPEDPNFPMVSSHDMG